MIRLKEVTSVTLERLFLYAILFVFCSWFLIQNQINLYVGCFFLATMAWGFLSVLIRFVPSRYVLKIDEQGITYFKLFSRIYLPWDEFQAAGIISNYVGGKLLWIYNTNGKLVIQFRGAESLTVYQLRDFFNALLQAYRGGELKNGSDLRQMFNKFKVEDKAEEKLLIEKSKQLIEASGKIDSIFYMSAPYYILKFPLFWLRAVGITLFCVSFGFLPNMILIAMLKHLNPLFSLFLFIVMIIAFLLSYLLYTSKSIVFYDSQKKYAYRAYNYFGRYCLSGKILTDVHKVEVWGTALSFYYIILSNENDKIFCGGVASRWTAIKIAERVSSVLNLPTSSFDGIKLNVLDFFFYVINYVMMIVIFGGLLFVNREVLKLIFFHGG